ncbi:hypothetical protein [Rhizomonospora bruguierae]|uniref:hypothetical protein n=1 Tax=Rhizomonospora bruguierae TaxID=1581705 RepID=UPI001BCEE4DE|nr:hypothetical protein [Micromonospora sp. NBRC 107566]
MLEEIDEVKRKLQIHLREPRRWWIGLEALVRRHRLPELTINALFDAAPGLRVRNAMRGPFGQGGRPAAGVRP